MVKHSFAKLFRLELRQKSVHHLLPTPLQPSVRASCVAITDCKNMKQNSENNEAKISHDNQLAKKEHNDKKQMEASQRI